MGTRSTIILALGVLLWGYCGLALDDARAADHEELRALRAQAANAISTGDLEELRGCLASDFTFIASDQSVLRSHEELVAYWNSMFADRNSPVIGMATTLTADILTTFVAPDVGYCYGTSNDVYTLKNKRRIAVENRWSAVVVREEGKWKVAVVHVGVNFLDNPVLRVESMS